jgi:ABC-type bacteriocin/lantibiotic exporter with double-glycine peptidase domain
MKRYVLNTVVVILVVALLAFNVWYLGLWTLLRGEPASAVATPVAGDPQSVLPGRRQDCGAKCLYLICKAAGKDSSIAQVRKLSKTTNDGTNMLELKNAAVALGFQVEAYDLPFRELRDFLSVDGRYAILHSSAEHFFPALGRCGNKVRVLDPAIGIEDVGEEQLRSARYQWNGKALLLTAR